MSNRKGNEQDEPEAVNEFVDYEILHGKRASGDSNQTNTKQLLEIVRISDLKR